MGVPVKGDDISAGFIECDECGHYIEDHETSGCQHTDPGDYGPERCACRARWTVREIQAYRRAAGLPAGDRRSWSYGSPG
jgi:hypothetical protein